MSTGKPAALKWTASDIMSLAAAIKLVFLALASMLLAATVLACAISGPIGLVAGPILMLFGWFFVPVVIVLHGVAWLIWPLFEKRRYGRYHFAACGALAGACVFALIGIKEVGSVAYYTAANAIAAAAAAFPSCLVIARMRRHA